MTSWTITLPALANRARTSWLALRAATSRYAAAAGEGIAPWSRCYDAACEDQAILHGYRRALVDVGVLSRAENDAWERYVSDAGSDVAPPRIGDALQLPGGQDAAPSERRQ